MATKYVYHYFNGQGRGEAVRWIFALAGEDFVDHRIDAAEWPEFRSQTPFGTLPFLEVDGKILGESLTIQRFLARRFGLVGSNEWEHARVDELVDYVTAKAEQVREHYLKAAETPLTKLQDMLAQNDKGEGYFVGQAPTWADIAITCYLDTIENFEQGFLAKYPTLKAYRERVRNYKGIKDWIAKRPKTAW
ncbi:glutathione S-transferase 1-like [Paramacrobiotus metropolitanus]|uniref:glutathione S-transferase 1-like n=1 Tax=Paramacrobiotus metropolitanus TaxID=2943436 RepID=UPI00244650A1|nr:glutathione S-transferase 1-like [Paramacrobiotus metropolitanus]